MKRCFHALYKKIEEGARCPHRVIVGIGCFQKTCRAVNERTIYMTGRYPSLYTADKDDGPAHAGWRLHARSTAAMLFTSDFLKLV